MGDLPPRGGRIVLLPAPPRMNWLDPLYMIAAAATAPWWARKERHGWAERFGKIDPVPDRGIGPRLLIHAVSVGEVNALRELVPLLTPHVQLIVSVGTDTGIKRARELFASSCDVVRYPVDASWAVKRFLDRVRPAAVGLVELELWPNFVAECNRRHVPVGVINGRLSERSFKGYRKLRWFMKRTFASLRFAAVQDEDYAERFRAMGVPPDRCKVTGNMKGDAARIADAVPGSEELARQLGIQRSPGAPPLVVAGSTGPGEEELLRIAVESLKTELGPIQLLCAPRKPERYDEAAAAMSGGGRNAVRRSRKIPGEPGATRFLLDSMGELRQAYALADVVVIGRSFGDLYGSDPLEPIALGKPTMIGPAIADFRTTVEQLERGGGILRTTRERLAGDLKRLLADADASRSLAGNGRECIRRMQGASQRHAKLLLEMLPQQDGGNAARPDRLTAPLPVPTTP